MWVSNIFHIDKNLGVSEGSCYQNIKKIYNKNSSNNCKIKQTNACNSFSYDKKHDFRLFKESKISFLESFLLMVDIGYQGLQKNDNYVLLAKHKSKTQ